MTGIFGEGGALFGPRTLSSLAAGPEFWPFRSPGSHRADASLTPLDDALGYDFDQHPDPP